MTRLTRRKFFKGASIGAAAIGTLAIVPGAANNVLAANLEPVSSKPVQSFEQILAGANFNQQLILHIDPQQRRMVLVYGDQEVTYNDAEMVSRLIEAVQNHSRV